jgi:hypothetical protein
MAVIRCKLAEDGRSVESADIEFESGDTIQFESGDRPLLAEDLPRELAVHVDSATVCLTLSKPVHHPEPPPPPPQPSGPSTYLVAGPDPGGGADKHLKPPGSQQLVGILVPHPAASSKASKATG